MIWASVSNFSSLFTSCMSLTLASYQPFETQLYLFTQSGSSHNCLRGCSRGYKEITSVKCWPQWAISNCYFPFAVSHASRLHGEVFCFLCAGSDTRIEMGEHQRSLGMLNALSVIKTTSHWMDELDFYLYRWPPWIHRPKFIKITAITWSRMLESTISPIKNL